MFRQLFEVRRRFGPASQGRVPTRSLTAGPPPANKSTQERGLAANMNALARVFFHMDPGDSHYASNFPRSSSGTSSRPAGTDRLVVLTDLVALRQIGVEILLASPDVLRVSTVAA